MLHLQKALLCNLIIGMNVAVVVHDQVGVSVCMDAMHEGQHDEILFYFERIDNIRTLVNARTILQLSVQR